MDIRTHNVEARRPGLLPGITVTKASPTSPTARFSEVFLKVPTQEAQPAVKPSPPSVVSHSRSASTQSIPVQSSGSKRLVNQFFNESVPMGPSLSDETHIAGSYTTMVGFFKEDSGPQLAEPAPREGSGAFEDQLDATIARFESILGAQVKTHLVDTDELLLAKENEFIAICESLSRLKVKVQEYLKVVESKMSKDYPQFGVFNDVCQDSLVRLNDFEQRMHECKRQLDSQKELLMNMESEIAKGEAKLEKIRERGFQWKIGHTVSVLVVVVAIWLYIWKAM